MQNSKVPIKISADALHKKLRHLSHSKRWNKIFCIGSHKTGTTTLNHIMHGLGFNCAPQAKLERDCVLESTKGNYKPLTTYINQFDFFQDSPFAHAHTYVALDALFPNSKFIYSYRDPEEWFKSNINFVSTWCNTRPSELSKSHYQSYGYIEKDYMIKKTEYYDICHVDEQTLSCKPKWELLFAREKYIKDYTNRRDEILRYFHTRPDDLLVINITKEETVSKVIDFLNYPSYIKFKMPRLNSHNTRDQKEFEITSAEFQERLERAS